MRDATRLENGGNFNKNRAALRKSCGKLNRKDAAQPKIYDRLVRKGATLQKRCEMLSAEHA